MNTKEAEALMAYTDARIHQYHLDSHTYVSVQELQDADVAVKKARQDVLALCVQPERIQCPRSCGRTVALVGEYDSCCTDCGMLVVRN